MLWEQSPASVWSHVYLETWGSRTRVVPGVVGPSMIMGNVITQPNKIDKLAALTKNNKIFRECSLLSFTETWLTACIPDASMERLDFPVRADRDTRACVKRKGGGLALYVNKQWCSPGHMNIKISTDSRDIELLAVSLQLSYLLKEFSHAIVLIAYIPPRANAIHRMVTEMQTQHPEALVLISGDFNHVTLTKHWLPSTSLWSVKPGGTGK